MNYMRFSGRSQNPCYIKFRSLINKGELSNSQKQAVTRLTEKNKKIKNLFKIGD